MSTPSNLAQALAALRRQRKEIIALQAVCPPSLDVIRDENDDATRNLLEHARIIEDQFGVRFPWLHPAKPEPALTPLPVEVETPERQGFSVAGDTLDGTLTGAWERRQSYEGSPVVDIQLNSRTTPGIALGLDGWADVPRWDPDWIGDRTLRIFAHPDGTRIEAPGENALIIRPTENWPGRVQFIGFTIEGGSRNAVDCGMYGSQRLMPCKDVRFYDATFVDGPNRPLRPVSMNQTSAAFIRCRVEMPGSREHWIYSRNGYGPLVIYECDLDGVGGQVLQEVSRATEGPQMERATTYIQKSTFRNYHRDPGRAGSALTMAGAGRDYVVEDCLLEDLDPSDGIYGAMVAWDGGSHYRLPSGYANGSLRMRDVTIRHGAGNRALCSFDDLESLDVKRCVFESENQPVKIGWDENERGVGSCRWEGNSGTARVLMDDRMDYNYGKVTPSDGFTWSAALREEGGE